MKKSFSIVALILLGNTAQVKILCNVIQETPDTIAQASALLSEQPQFSAIFVLDQLISW